MEVTIQFKNGTTLMAEKNGTSYIALAAPAFPADLSVVTVVDGATIEVLHNVHVQECASVDGRYWFALLEETEQERTIRELREENDMLEDAIAELAAIIGGGE